MVGVYGSTKNLPRKCLVQSLHTSAHYRVFKGFVVPLTLIATRNRTPSHAIVASLSRHSLTPIFISCLRKNYWWNNPHVKTDKFENKKFFQKNDKRVYEEGFRLLQLFRHIFRIILCVGIKNVCRKLRLSYGIAHFHAKSNITFGKRVTLLL